MKIPAASPQQWRTLAAAAFLAGWLLYFAGGGLWAPFSGDDLRNLHQYLLQPFSALVAGNLRYWSSAYRPLGGLFYVTLYRLFGFTPLPFRVACFALLFLNLALLYRFCRLLAGSREIAWLAVFLASYHAWFADLYYSSGTVYDLLCFSFYFAAFNYYAGIRRSGRELNLRELALVAGLYICALNAKEMAVTLPLFLLIYEALYQFPKNRPAAFRQWLMRAGRGVLMTALLTVPYAIGKLRGPDSLIQNPAYRLSISPGRFLGTFRLYLNPLLYQDHVFRAANTVFLLAAMIGLAAYLRSRPMIFAWFFLIFSLLPVAFIGHYSAFFLYVPMAGWSLYAACVLARARNGITQAVGGWRPIAWLANVPQSRINRMSQIVLIAVLAILLAPLHARETRKVMQLFLSAQPPVRQTAADLANLQLKLRRGANVLFVDDPFPADDYFLLYLTRLFYGDMSIEVDRTSVRSIAAHDYRRYDAVLFFHGDRLAAR